MSQQRNSLTRFACGPSPKVAMGAMRGQNKIETGFYIIPDGKTQIGGSRGEEKHKRTAEREISAVKRRKDWISTFQPECEI